MSTQGAVRIDGKKLQRPRWVTPAIMTAGTVFTFYAICWVFIAIHNQNASGSFRPNYISFDAPGLWPLYIGLFLGACGLMFGARFISGARENIGNDFGVRYVGNDHPLARRIHAMAERLDLPPPAVGVTNVVNAFAMGSTKEAAVVIGVPLARMLTAEELDAVIGHELGHIATGDMQRMQFAEGYQQMFGVLFGAFTNAIIAAIARNSRSGTNVVAAKAIGHVGRYLLAFVSELMVKGLSRTREYHADAVGAALTSPEAMTRALEKVHGLTSGTSPAENQYAYLMFNSGRVGRLFSTHPTFEQRRDALRSESHLSKLPRLGPAV